MARFVRFLTRQVAAPSRQIDSHCDPRILHPTAYARVGTIEGLQVNQVLLVNDDDKIRDRTAAMLIDLSWEVYVANGEDRVFESMVARRPDLLIVDIEMECGTGFEAISTARRLFASLFIVAVTRGGHEGLWSEGASACGADIYIVGPVSKSKLAAAIDSGLDQGLISCGQPTIKSPYCH